MTAINRPSLGLFPWGMTNGTLSIQTLTLDASGDRIGFVFQAPEAATLTHGGFRYGTRTGTPPTYRISFQGVDGSGNPDGTILGGGSPASATFTPPADTTWNSTWQWISLTNSIAVTRGQLLSMVVDYSSGTINGSNFGSFTYTGIEFCDSSRMGFPYNLTDNSGSWTKQNNSAPIWGYKSSTQVFGHPLLSQSSTVTDSTNTRAATKINLAAGFGDTYKIAGLRVNTSAPGGTWKMGLWDAAGSVVQDISIDGDVSAAAGSGIRIHEFYFDESSLTALSFGTTYYLGVERNPTDTQVYDVRVSAANDMKAFPGGDGFILATWNGSAWTETSTIRPQIEPIFDDWTEPAGGGGGGASRLLQGSLVL